ncbi:heavy-metal-associated domain-containing protein [Campylobacter hepaticus]|uniref:Heavy-metal-associated domain-containing protein n=1 Tax=Campylobacter hepaticus TaxID=1813019 RepID=A0A424YZG1_9BACT|nr:heavy-metal-associated domain-containing protein [Campylobacter hepaticus]AXP08355.1 heavy-metal-associated domain-containing protein [Campylobacter hepaticus]MCZ0772180.1 heavy-metal-associated domain-containing protein [Campylobacter hepaticus]MCZ0773649.1 heavy-metal-associated domain-containing protein [Campylobacter hepaticus]MCZ0774899.1 heavy-metal-associated domain-containing protein [Campylobacter hepaticus]MDX2322780.1 heavy-metal-associated domain-containing protein [Campylobacte
MQFKVKNINCINCVNLIKNSLEYKFGLIQIDLDSKILSIDLKEEQILDFTKEIKELGFEIIERL